MNAKKLKITAVLLMTFTIISATLFYRAGSELTAPAHRKIGHPPKKLNAEDVSFFSSGGKNIKGWLIRSHRKKGVVILMHGVRGDRRAMAERAEFLYENGYSVLLFDFQAHGESDGEYISFGYHEAEDARAAVGFIKKQFPSQPAAVIGQSLGGAACLIGDEPIAVNALILESVYPTIEEAVANRLEIYMGKIAGYFTPMLTLQIRARFNIDPEKLRPENGIRKIRCPVLIISGDEDRRTTLPETKRLYRTAPEPKQLWIIEGAAHQDLYRFAKEKYEERILEFLNDNFILIGSP